MGLLSVWLETCVGYSRPSLPLPLPLLNKSSTLFLQYSTCICYNSSILYYTTKPYKVLHILTSVWVLCTPNAGWNMLIYFWGGKKAEKARKLIVNFFTFSINMLKLTKYKGQNGTINIIFGLIFFVLLSFFWFWFSIYSVFWIRSTGPAQNKTVKA